MTNEELIQGKIEELKANLTEWVSREFAVSPGQAIHVEVSIVLKYRPIVTVDVTVPQQVASDEITDEEWDKILGLPWPRQELREIVKRLRQGPFIPYFRGCKQEAVQIVLRKNGLPFRIQKVGRGNFWDTPIKMGRFKGRYQR
jgi:hypothetical protein